MAYTGSYLQFPAPPYYSEVPSPHSHSAFPGMYAQPQPMQAAMTYPHTASHQMAPGTSGFQGTYPHHATYPQHASSRACSFTIPACGAQRAASFTAGTLGSTARAASFAAATSVPRVASFSSYPQARAAAYPQVATTSYPGAFNAQGSAGFSHCGNFGGSYGYAAPATPSVGSFTMSQAQPHLGSFAASPGPPPLGSGLPQALGGSSATPVFQFYPEIGRDFTVSQQPAASSQQPAAISQQPPVPGQQQSAGSQQPTTTTETTKPGTAPAAAAGTASALKPQKTEIRPLTKKKAKKKNCC